VFKASGTYYILRWIVLILRCPVMGYFLSQDYIFCLIFSHIQLNAEVIPHTSSL